MKKSISQFIFNKKLLYILLILATIDRIYYYRYPEIKAWCFQLIHSSPVHWENVLIPYDGRLIYLESDSNITFTDSVGDPYGILFIRRIIHRLDVDGLINKYLSDGYHLILSEKIERWGTNVTVYQLASKDEIATIYILLEKKLVIAYYGRNNGMSQFGKLLSEIVIQ